MESILIAVDGSDGILQRSVGSNEGSRARPARLDDSLRCAGQGEAVAVVGVGQRRGWRAM